MVQAMVDVRQAALIALVIVLTIVGASASACGYSAYTRREGEAHYTKERAQIRWDGRTKDIFMELGVEGQSKEAAWILPLPIQGAVQLGNTHLFDVTGAEFAARVVHPAQGVLTSFTMYLSAPGWVADDGVVPVAASDDTCPKVEVHCAVMSRWMLKDIPDTVLALVLGFWLVTEGSRRLGWTRRKTA